MEYIYNNIKDIPVDIEYPDNFEEVIKMKFNIHN